MVFDKHTIKVHLQTNRGTPRAPCLKCPWRVQDRDEGVTWRSLGGHWFALHANQQLFREKKTSKDWVSSQTWGFRHDKPRKKAGAAEAPSSAVVVDHLGIADYVVDEQIWRSCLGPLLLGFLYLFSPKCGHNQVIHYMYLPSLLWAIPYFGKSLVDIRNVWAEMLCLYLT